MKNQILDIISDHARVLTVADTIAALAMPRQRYKNWRRDRRKCLLTNTPAEKCPRSYPNQLTTAEVTAMKHFITSPNFAHFSIAALSMDAKRTGELFVTSHTWYKYVRDNNWRRPLIRKKKPYKIGIRADKIDQIWHVDVSEWEYDPGKKAYIQTVIDNYSCYVLAVNVTTHIRALNTVSVLKLAFLQSQKKVKTSTILLTDGGSENDNHLVKDFVASQENFEHAIARIDVRFSNAGSPYLITSEYWQDSQL